MSHNYLGLIVYFLCNKAILNYVYVSSYGSVHLNVGAPGVTGGCEMSEVKNLDSSAKVVLYLSTEPSLQSHNKHLFKLLNMWSSISQLNKYYSKM